MTGRTLAEHEVRAAMEKCPAELHRLLIWLCTGKTVPSSGTVTAAA